MGRVECEVSTPHAWSNQWDIGVYERYARLTPVKITFVAAALVALIVGGTEIFSGAACIHSIQRSTYATCFDGSFDRQRGAPNMDISLLLDNNGSTGALRIEGGWPDGLTIAHFVLTCLGFLTTYIILGLSTVSAMLAWAVFAVAFAVLTVADGFTLHAWSRTYCRNTSLPAIVNQLAVTTPAQADLVQKILTANATSVNVVCQSATSTFLVALLAVCALSASVAVYSTHADRSMYIAELSEDTYIECQ
ncbi:hypothetical protein SPRG_14580 [Saprolegnia parasitica CBS 223.65]|uniref:Uncharacterized protein n=1 Tax=Saprolegnia parasitica (strain CBS 223.65) TaxID=695850 RepID=A0A067BT42_SAPPC|nr:hypothetical protein SPRG_14580 [Saprolegnia parasitica CBS 223.65]KDO20000.1 hypothetical protein SPRG_14580 [Saprolegnia parasitica CBS 223.65]|eukprot:XP_012209303.1 hypothetical protein SPRG_14580 [Saprolegnia parasitica CBS 223.65]